MGQRNGTIPSEQALNSYNYPFDRDLAVLLPRAFGEDDEASHPELIGTPMTQTNGKENMIKVF